jgi:hypothetical protein
MLGEDKSSRSLHIVDEYFTLQFREEAKTVGAKSPVEPVLTAHHRP